MAAREPDYLLRALVAAAVLLSVTLAAVLIMPGAELERADMEPGSTGALMRSGELAAVDEAAPELVVSEPEVAVAVAEAVRDAQAQEAGYSEEGLSKIASLSEAVALAARALEAEAPTDADREPVVQPVPGDAEAISGMGRKIAAKPSPAPVAAEAAPEVAVIAEPAAEEEPVAEAVPEVVEDELPGEVSVAEAEPLEGGVPEEAEAVAEAAPVMADVAAPAREAEDMALVVQEAPEVEEPEAELLEAALDDAVTRAEAPDMMDLQAEERRVVAPLTEPVTHVVQPGESLQSIAYEFYGVTSRYMLIFEANRKILPSPDELWAGQRLTIPVDPRANP